MNDPKIVYSVNLIIGAILAGVMSRHWRRVPTGSALHYWIVAAWTLTVADLLFVLRATFPYEATRMIPTLMVTVGQLVLIFAAQRTTGRQTSMRSAVLIFSLHLLFQIGFIVMPQFVAWRSVGNAVVWSGLSFSAAWFLSRRVGPQRSIMQLPALVLAAHGLFHLVRLSLATRSAAQSSGGSSPLLQLVGDLEVSLFMVALFVSVLVAFLEQRNRELGAAIEDVRQLSSMLPLCAWCKNVRDDDGYWTQIEAYLASHHVNVTHSICEDCAAKHFEGRAPVPVPAEG